MKSNKVIKLTQAIERKYGSVMNAPYNCPELIETHKIFETSQGSYRHMTELKVNKIKNKIMQGYSMKETATILQVSPNTIRRVAIMNDLKILKRLKYKYHIDNQDYYAPARKYLIRDFPYAENIEECSAHYCDLNKGDKYFYKGNWYTK